MRVIRTGAPTSTECWDVPEIMDYLKCDKMKAQRIIEGYHAERGESSYGPVERALILDYIEKKQREEREREARYKSDLANIESVTVLKEQVKALKEHVNTLKEQVKTLNEQLEASKEAARAAGRNASSAKHWAMFASILSIITTIVISLAPYLSKSL